MRVKRNPLLLIACLVWSAAGFNILRIGILAYAAYVTGLNLLLSALVFVSFQRLVFGRLVVRHTARIRGYADERLCFLKFFDRRSFILMAVMMLGGLVIRRLVPEMWIAVFYSGLGASLMLAGILFGRNYRKAIQATA